MSQQKHWTSFAEALANNHVDRNSPIVATSEDYPLELIANIAAKMPLLSEGADEAAAQAVELLEACKRTLEKGAYKRAELALFTAKTPRGTFKWSAGRITFSSGAAFITGQERLDRSTEEFTLLIRQAAMMNKDLAIASLTSSHARTPYSDEAKREFSDFILGRRDLIGLEKVFVEKFQHRGFQLEEVFHFKRLFAHFEKRGIMDEVRGINLKLKKSGKKYLRDLFAGGSDSSPAIIDKGTPKPAKRIKKTVKKVVAAASKATSK